MLRDVRTEISDGQLGLGAAKGAGVHVKIGVSPNVSETPIVITGSMNAQRIRERLGLSPLADAVMDSVENGSNRVLCIPVAASTPGTLGEVTKTGTGGGSCTAAGNPNNAFDIIVVFTGQGGFNTAVYKYSINGGYSYSNELTLPLTGVVEIPSTGVTLTFTQAQGEESTSYKVGDKYTLSTTAPQMTNQNVLDAIGTLKNLKQEFEFVHIVGESQKSLWAAVAAEQVTLAGTHHKPVFFIMEAYNKGTEESAQDYALRLEADRVGIANFDIQVVAARSLYKRMDGVTKEINNAGIVCGLYAKAKLQQSIGETRTFGIAEEKMLELRPVGIEEHIRLLDTAKYLTFRGYTGLSGFYVTNARVMAPEGSDFRYAEDVRIKNKIIRETRKEALLNLQSDIDLEDVQGSLEAIAKFVEAPLDEMARAKEITSATITVPQGQDILTTETLQLTIRYVPVGHLREIVLDIGMTNPFRS